MTESDLAYLKSRVDQLVSIETASGEHLTAKVILVFDGEDSPDLFYEVVFTSTPDFYRRHQYFGYSMQLSEIISVRPPQ